MAFFYEHIKGINSEGVVTTMTWESSAAPILNINNEDWGNLITSKAQLEGDTQTIETPIKANYFISTDNIYYFNNNTANISFDNDSTVSFNKNKTEKLNIVVKNIDSKGDIYSTGALTVKKAATVNSLNCTTNASITGELSGSTANFSNSCTALYFNTLSDARYKTNFKNFDIEDAKKLVLNIPILSFDYKDTNIPSFGILAQDLDFYNTNELPLVNKTDPNKWTIAEDKLIYILWATVQDLYKEIEELKGGK